MTLKSILNLNQDIKKPTNNYVKFQAKWRISNKFS